MSQTLGEVKQNVSNHQLDHVSNKLGPMSLPLICIKLPPRNFGLVGKVSIWHPLLFFLFDVDVTMFRGVHG